LDLINNLIRAADILSILFNLFFISQINFLAISRKQIDLIKFSEGKVAFSTHWHIHVCPTYQTLVVLLRSPESEIGRLLTHLTNSFKLGKLLTSRNQIDNLRENSSVKGATQRADNDNFTMISI
jgi:hypothetical protein